MRLRNPVAYVVLFCVAIAYPALRDLVAQAPQAGNSGMIFVPVTVIDAKKAPVMTLKTEHFQVLEEGKEQKIAYFSGAGDSGTVGVMLALSGRGPVKVPGQRDRITVDIQNAVTRLREANKAGMALGLEDLQYDSDGFYDVLGRNLAKLEKVAASRKALVVISDGMIASGSQASNMTVPKAMLEAAKESAFPIYFLFVVSSLPEPSLMEQSTTSIGYGLEQIAQSSGGEMIVGEIDNNLTSVSSQLRDTLQNQYLLGFNSSNAAKDGKWRKLAVKVTPPDPASKFKLEFRERYFVPKAADKK